MDPESNFGHKGAARMPKAAIYARVSTPDQHIETQLYQLRELAARRGYEIVHEYTVSGSPGSKSRRPGRNALQAGAHVRRSPSGLGAGSTLVPAHGRHLLT